MRSKPIDLVGYRYSIIATYANTSADEVYSIVKAIDESMDLIKAITASAGNWAPNISGKPPADARPAHAAMLRIRDVTRPARP